LPLTAKKKKSYDNKKTGGLALGDARWHHGFCAGSACDEKKTRRTPSLLTYSN
jgi:hypothetical protein